MLKLISLVLWVAAATTFVSAYTIVVPRDQDQEFPGGPGLWPEPDRYNTYPDVNWNRTYEAFEPQQIHLSLADDSKYARIEFATLSPAEQSSFKYWPKKHDKSVEIVQPETWEFEDGGEAHRTISLYRAKTRKLRAATVYQYQVGAFDNDKSKWSWSSVYEFHTGSKRKEFSFIAIGDIGLNNAVTLPQLIELSKTHKYDFLTLSGDQAYDMKDFDGTKGDQYMNLMQEVWARVPYLGVPGNHEGAYNYTHYKNRFKNVPFEDSGFDNPLMYSVNYKSLHLVSFSTEVYFDGTDDMIQTAINWLDADLTEANKHRKQRPWIILITHHPVYCSAPNTEDCTTKAALLRDGKVNNVTGEHWGGLEPILLKHKVDLYLTGHVHNYERTLPVAKGKVAGNGVLHNPASYVEVIIGNAGPPEPTVLFNMTGPFHDWSAVRYDSYGYSTVNVSPSKLDFTHHQVHQDGSLGTIADTFSLTKN
ncbi:Metallo-dependent phosphatase-like protein [Phascolomyces articulosus]|uniref:Purple acid phosphatase n=1 Tax=Phascolomyces articulosus TaxID=60185 RepID=A0AAD5K8T0_9FUNG|nr:Metallo-dependent phosphatase-like protein [Phascolomyces articulosus]